MQNTGRYLKIYFFSIILFLITFCPISVLGGQNKISYKNNSTILVQEENGSEVYLRHRNNESDKNYVPALVDQYEVSFKVEIENTPLENAEVLLYSDFEYPSVWGYTDSNGLIEESGGNTVFTMDGGPYTLFIVSRADNTAIVTSTMVSSDGEILLDITDEWASTTTLSVNARKIDSQDSLSGSIYLSISKAWPRSIGQIYSGNIEIFVTPHIYYYLGLWNWSEGYYLYESDLNVPLEGQIVNFYPTSQDSCIVSVNGDNFDDTSVIPWLEVPELWMAPVLNLADIVMTPGTYSINMDLEKEDWRFYFYLVDNYLFTGGSTVEFDGGGNFSIETFDTNSDTYQPGDTVFFSINIQDGYDHGLWYSWGPDYEQNYPNLAIKDPWNAVIYDNSTSFTFDFYTLDSTAKQGTYEAILTFDTGPHQGEISQTISFQVGSDFSCAGDFDGDGDVDDQDLVVFTASFGPIICEQGQECDGDFDGDGDVDGSDLEVFTGTFGRTDCP